MLESENHWSRMHKRWMRDFVMPPEPSVLKVKVPTHLPDSTLNIIALLSRGGEMGWVELWSVVWA